MKSSEKNISVCRLRNSQAKLRSAAYIISREVVVSLGFWSDILFSFVIYLTFAFEVNRKLSFYKKSPIGPRDIPYNGLSRKFRPLRGAFFGKRLIKG